MHYHPVPPPGKHEHTGDLQAGHRAVPLPDRAPTQDHGCAGAGLITKVLEEQKSHNEGTKGTKKKHVTPVRSTFTLKLTNRHRVVAQTIELKRSFATPSFTQGFGLLQDDALSHYNDCHSERSEESHFSIYL